MKVMLHLRDGVTPARFKTDLSKAIRSGEHKAWEVLKARPALVIRHAGRFRGTITFKAPARRRSADHRPPDVVATIGGKGSERVLVLRYFVYLVASKLGDQVEGFYIPVEPSD
jgi:hypothetical protein